MINHSDHRSPPPLQIELNDLTAVNVVGRGAKGIVFYISLHSSEETFALKVMSRSFIENKKAGAKVTPGDDGRQIAYKRICFERDVLLALRHPLFPSLHRIVSTEKILGFAIDYCPGGDLNALRRRQSENMFSESAIRFYASELVLALEYLHGLGIVYRDLKPENVLIQENGHIMLVDFDLAAKFSPSETSPEILRFKPSSVQKWSFLKCFSGMSDVSPETNEFQPKLTKSNSFVGTEDYVAPEIIAGDGHDVTVDWWCLGIVLYEMLYGRTPFRGSNRKETFYRILTMPPVLVGEKTALRDLIGRLLEKDPAKRITGEEVRRHDFFRGVQWDFVLEIARPPFIPAAAAEPTDCDRGLDIEKIVEGVLWSPRDGNPNVLVEKHVTEMRNTSRSGDLDLF